MLKKFFKRSLKEEAGHVFILALIILAFGSLALAPLLNYMGTGLKAGQTFEEKTSLIYAADAGIEDAIWKLIYDFLSIKDSFPDEAHEYALSNKINDKNVDIVIKYVRSGTYQIKSTAGNDNGSSATVTAYVGGLTHMIYGKLELSSGEVLEGDFIVDGDVELSADAGIIGSIYSTGDIILNARAEIIGVVCSEGNLELNASGIVVDNDVYVGGYVKMNAHTIISGNVHAHGQELYQEYAVYLDNHATIEGEVWSNKSIRVNGPQSNIGNVHITEGYEPSGPGSWGEIYYDYERKFCEKPQNGGGIDSYTIN